MMLKEEAEDGVFDFFGAPECFVIIDFACFRDKLRLVGKFGCQEIRIYGDAMSSHARTWLQNVDMQELVGEFDQFPNVDTCLVADQRQFVGKSYLDVT